MSSLYKSVCFADIAQAKAAQCSDQAFSWARDDGTVFSSRCSGPDSLDETMYIKQYMGSDEYNAIKIVYSSFPDCDYSGGVDVGVEYFGLVVGALIVIAMAARLKQIFWKNHEGI